MELKYFFYGLFILFILSCLGSQTLSLNKPEQFFGSIFGIAVFTYLLYLLTKWIIKKVKKLNKNERNK